MHILIEKPLGPHTKASGWAWRLGWQSQSWIVFAALALVASLASLAFETGAGGLGWISIAILTLVVAALLGAGQHRWQARRAFFSNPDETLVSFFELTGDRLSYGIRDRWRTDMAWSTYVRHQLTGRYLILCFGSIDLFVARHDLSTADIQALETHIRGLSTHEAGAAGSTARTHDDVDDD